MSCWILSCLINKKTCVEIICIRIGIPLKCLNLFYLFFPDKKNVIDHASWVDKLLKNLMN